MRKGAAYHSGPRKEYRYFPVSYPSRGPRDVLVHAMRPDIIGRTVCANEPQSWTRLDSAEVTCKTCRKWIEIQGAEAAS